MMYMIHPITVCGIKVSSNVFFAPINPGWSTNGLISNKYMDFFLRYAGRDIGICYVGNVALQNEWSSNANTAVLSATPDEHWTELSKRIAAKGSLPGIQLAWKPPQITLQRGFVASDPKEQLKLFKEFYNTFWDFENVATQFITSIKSAVTFGFSVVQIHAAHGYALSLLLSRTVSGLNTPEETKGIELLRKIMAGLNKGGSILDIRLSLYEGFKDDTSELKYKMRLVELLLECGFDMISLSNGFYNIDKTMIYPAKKDRPPILGEAEQFARRYPKIIWNVAGNMENVLASGMALPDNLTFSLGRQLLADPDTVMKMKCRTYDNIQFCSECNACHYYSNGFNGIQGCHFSGQE